jgi:hypothetical protein
LAEGERPGDYNSEINNAHGVLVREVLVSSKLKKQWELRDLKSAHPVPIVKIQSTSTYEYEIGAQFAEY